MSIIRSDELIRLVGNPGRDELERFAELYGIMGTDTSNEHDYITLAVMRYARGKYPNASAYDVASFGSILPYLATGMYGGFGTDQYWKEELADMAIIAACGGVPPAPGELLAIMPRGAKLDTAIALDFLTEWYFGDSAKALIELGVKTGNLDNVLLTKNQLESTSPSGDCDEWLSFSFLEPSWEYGV
ncbi:hypothetical protein AS159_01570 [Thermotoga sp. Ku-13t]|uniref:hypothetical protein n=1 Tax=Thermotoga sp. Ku-13t TaxID=1755813 RepID=UPI0013EBFAD7|nr:hypothetical protein [Thermotoga sp. Ku-13t]KAF2958416.1 hypothetical protein AS159_01570 [Thermotoga sp. Ku-13t]